MREELQKIVESMKSGVDIETASALHGVRFSTVISLIKDGETEVERRDRGMKERASYNEAAAFYGLATQARAAAMANLIASVSRAAGQDWKASRYLLGTMDPKYSD